MTRTEATAVTAARPASPAGDPPPRQREEQPPGGEVQLAFVRHVETRDEGVRRDEVEEEPEDAEPGGGPLPEADDSRGKERREEEGLRKQDRRPTGEDGQVGSMFKA